MLINHAIQNPLNLNIGIWIIESWAVDPVNFFLSILSEIQKLAQIFFKFMWSKIIFHKYKSNFVGLIKTGMSSELSALKYDAITAFSIQVY